MFLNFMMAENSTCCNFRKHMRIEKHLQIKKTSSSIRQITNKEMHYKCSQFHFQRVLCSVVLWAFAARMLSNGWSCFLNLQVFFYVRWALSATVEFSGLVMKQTKKIDTVSKTKSKNNIILKKLLKIIFTFCEGMWVLCEEWGMICL